MTEMEPLPEPCGICGFDSALYDDADMISSQSVIGPVLAAAIEGLDGEAMEAQSGDGVLSIAQHVDRAREAAAVQLSVIEGGRASEQGVLARQALHHGLHHLAEIGRLRHQLGYGARLQTGTVVQLNTSGGGVPKHPVTSVSVSGSGLEGDVQHDRRHHGRPIQAVCLWSADVIDRLRDEGHPIGYGNAGENVTIAGIDWEGLRPGARVDVGPVPLLITAHAIPCAKNAQWFSDRDFNRILHTKNPGLSRLYALPLTPGTISTGDEVVVEP